MIYFEIGLSAFFLFSIYIFLGAFLERKNWTVLKLILLFTFATFVYSICGYIFIKFLAPFSVIRTTMLFMRTAISMGLMTIPYKGPLIKKMFLLTLAFALSVITEMSVLICLNLTNYIPYGYSSNESEVFGTSLHFLLLFLIVITISKLRRRYKVINKSKFLYALEFLVPLISLIVIPSSYYILKLHSILIICAYSLVVNIFVYLIHNWLEIYYEKTQKLKLMNQRYRMYTEYYENLEQQQIEIRTIKHDLKNKLIVLSAYANKGETNMVKNEIHDLQKQLSDKV